MAKQSGLGDYCLVDGYDFSGDIGSLSRIGGGPALGEVTGITKGAPERLGLLRDGGIDFAAWFNPSTGQEHKVLSTLPTADRQVTYCRGLGIGNQAASLIGKQISYDATRAADGSLVLAVSTQSNGYGIEWGEQLTAGKRTDTTATNGAVLDFGSTSTLFGWQAYAHLIAFTGTNITLTIQDSADNATFATLTGGAFAAFTGIGAQRIEGGRTATVRRYLRVASSGTFTSATFLVNFVRNQSAVTF